MSWASKLPALLLAVMVLGGRDARAAGPPSEFGVDAPELAHLGRFAVGVRTLALIDRKQEDVLDYDIGTHQFPRINRPLTVDLWYPARVAAGAARETYIASLPSQPPAPPARFSVPGIAVRDAQPAGTGYP